MKVWVSSLAKVHDTAATVRPARVVSLLSPGDIFPNIDGVSEGGHHKVHMHDIREPMDNHVTPGERHVTELLAFLKTHDPNAPMLVHCWAGISRSTATALIAACLYNPGVEERRIADDLRKASPTAFPNTLIAAHADRLMGRDGRLVSAVEDICSDMDRAEQVARLGEGEPFSLSLVYDE
ncbi:MAG: protein-tyrosine phosphatase family protein [Pseudomonadota bacterium]